jgi:hypothetical protein
MPELARLEAELAPSFEKHPDAEIYRSLPGLGIVLGARVLSEFGDDRTRFAHPKARKNYAGNSPITKTSGTRRVILARWARNRRLADACYQWAFCALTKSAGAHQYYAVLRQRGRTHHQALRALANRLVGILHGCLDHRQAYCEDIAWSIALPLDFSGRGMSDPPPEGEGNCQPPPCGPAQGRGDYPSPKVTLGAALTRRDMGNSKPASTGDMAAVMISPILCVS